MPDQFHYANSGQQAKYQTNMTNPYMRKVIEAQLYDAGAKLYAHEQSYMTYRFKECKGQHTSVARSNWSILQLIRAEQYHTFNVQ